jgi:hypothetical protein
LCVFFSCFFLMSSLHFFNDFFYASIFALPIDYILNMMFYDIVWFHFICFMFFAKKCVMFLFLNILFLFYICLVFVVVLCLYLFGKLYISFISTVWHNFIYKDKNHNMYIKCIKKKQEPCVYTLFKNSMKNMFFFFRFVFYFLMLLFMILVCVVPFLEIPLSNVFCKCWKNRAKTIFKKIKHHIFL